MTLGHGHDINFLMLYSNSIRRIYILLTPEICRLHIKYTNVHKGLTSFTGPIYRTPVTGLISRSNPSLLVCPMVTGTATGPGPSVSDCRREPHQASRIPHFTLQRPVLIPSTTNPLTTNTPTLQSSILITPIPHSPPRSPKCHQQFASSAP